MGSLKALEVLVAAAADAAQAVEALKPLRQLHDLRTKVEGNASRSTRDELIKAAIKEAGSLKQHYEISLASALDRLRNVYD